MAGQRVGHGYQTGSKRWVFGRQSHAPRSADRREVHKTVHLGAKWAPSWSPHHDLENAAAERLGRRLGSAWHPRCPAHDLSGEGRVQDPGQAALMGSRQRPDRRSGGEAAPKA